MGLIYLLCFLDRANSPSQLLALTHSVSQSSHFPCAVGNAYTAGMDVSLGLTANERAAAISGVSCLLSPSAVPPRADVPNLGQRSAVCHLCDL